MSDAVSSERAHYDDAWLDREMRRCRQVALEDAARRVDDFRMPRAGDGPVTMLEVKCAIASAIRSMKK